MTVELRDRVVELSGNCPNEDAEPLLSHLASAPDVTVDWRRCERAHLAVVQVLLAAGRPVVGPPAGAFLARWVEPLLRNR
jgi:hypothetical protein